MEYALLVALIAVVCIAAVTVLGGASSDKFNEAGEGVSPTPTTAAPTTTTAAPTPTGCAAVHANGYATAAGDPNGNCYAPGVGYYTI